MRFLLCIFAAIAILVGAIFYQIGYRSGAKRSPAEEDQRGLIVLTLSGYKSVEATNWPKVKSLITTELYGFTREYERRFGAPSGTNDFVRRFQEAKSMTDRIEKDMVPINALGQVIESRSSTNGAK
jgi:hypothetical protein